MEVGIDLVDLKRLDLTNTSFINGVLSPKEIELFNSFKSEKRKREFLGGRFACKEALLKALGTGLKGIRMNEIEILANEDGKPLLKKPRLSSILSISHEGEMAVAICILL